MPERLLRSLRATEMTIIGKRAGMLVCARIYSGFARAHVTKTDILSSNVIFSELEPSGFCALTFCL